MRSGIRSLVTRSMPSCTPAAMIAAVIPRTSSVRPSVAGTFRTNSAKNSPNACWPPVTAPVAVNQM
jgi:hypothetical protein